MTFSIPVRSEPLTSVGPQPCDAVWLRCCSGAQGRGVGAGRAKPEAACERAAPSASRCSWLRASWQQGRRRRQRSDMKAACPSVHGHPAPAASAPAWPAGSARELHSPSLSFSFALTPAPPAMQQLFCSRLIIGDVTPPIVIRATVQGC